MLIASWSGETCAVGATTRRRPSAAAGEVGDGAGALVLGEAGFVAGPT